MRMPVVSKLHHLLRWAPALLFAVALVVVHRQLSDHQFAELAQTWRSVPWRIPAAAILLTLVNYGVLAGYDLLALRATGHGQMPLGRILLASFVSFGISNNTGHAWASGGSIRYRFYNAFGVPGWDVAKISFFLALTYIVGVLTLGSFAALAAPGLAPSDPATLRIFHIMIGGSLAALLVYWLAVLCWRRPLRIRGIAIALPTPSLALGQTMVSCLDLVLASLVLWVFLHDVPGLTFPTFLAIYAIASLLALASQVPGGLGVFEGAFLWLAGPMFGTSNPAIVAGLVFYRIIYYFMPLAMAGLLLLGHDLHDRRRDLVTVGRLAARLIPSTVPQVFALLLFLAGGVLLVSGATPSLPANMKWLRSVIPLPLVEFSHLTGSLVGVLLLFLARGIRQKLDAAWYGALCLLAVGIVASLLKGLDWQEALILSAMFAGIFVSRRYFYRKSSLLRLSLDPTWLLMIAMVIAGTTWLGFFAYNHVEYSNDLWWQFSYKNDASRFLRSLIVIGVVALAMLIRHLLTVYRPAAVPNASPQDLEQALPLIRRANETQGHLALLGDKALFWSDDRSAFLSYAVTSGYWIAMSDPVGLESSFEGLLWRFREEADRYGAKVVFYQVSEQHLPLYLDLGLGLLKLGEEARVALPGFSLEGRRRENLRNRRKKLLKQDFAFRILELPEMAAAMPRLKAISDLWLAQKKAREKRFSLGYFDEGYIKRTRVGVATAPNGTIMAFANLWETDGREELSIDLMRYDPASPGGVMDFLIAELMLWARDQGYRWFNLGVAPLSGLERHPLAPLWHKIGTAIFELGEELYNFEGLYEYKAKFEPTWRPRYLATPPGLFVPLILLTITRLIAGSAAGIIIKHPSGKAREHPLPGLQPAAR
jgi:phosphatidylglycerol lysyltransferase